MTTSEIISICAVVISCISSITAVIIAVCNYKQNKRMFIENNQADIMISIQRANMPDFTLYLVFHNQGKVQAQITNLKMVTYDKDYNSKEENINLGNVLGRVLPANKSFVVQMDYDVFKEDCKLETPDFDLIIEYEDCYGVHESGCPINFEIYDKNYFSDMVSEGQELKTIAGALKEIAIRNL